MDPSCGRELDPVVDEVNQHFQNPVRVGIDQRNFRIDRGFDPDLILIGSRLHHRDCLLDDLSDRNTARLDPQLAALGARRLQQVADHGLQLRDALQRRSQVIGLPRRDRSGQPIEHQRQVLVNAGQGRAQFVRNVRQKLVLEFQLLPAGDVECAQQRLPFHRIAHRPFQMLTGDVALDQVVLHALVHGLHREHFVVLAGKNYHRHVGSLLDDAPESFGAMAVRQIQIQQHQRGRLCRQRLQGIRQPRHTFHLDWWIGLDQSEPHQVRVPRIVFNQQNVRRRFHYFFPSAVAPIQTGIVRWTGRQKNRLPVSRRAHSFRICG